MKYQSNKHNRHSFLILVAATLLLGACVNDNNSCDSPVKTAGEPDLTDSPVFLSATVAQNTSVDINVPVDSETVEGTVYLLPSGSQNIADSVSTTLFMVTTPGVAETVTVTMPIGTPATGLYYPVVLLCDSVFATCTQGAGYVEDISGILTDPGVYVRGTADGGNIDLSSIKDSCVNINSIQVTL